MNDLLSSVKRYKAAHEAAQKCPEMILSSGRTEEPIRLMKELDAAREEMFRVSDEPCKHQILLSVAHGYICKGCGKFIESEV